MPQLISIKIDQEDCNRLIAFLEEYCQDEESLQWGRQVIQLLKDAIININPNSSVSLIIDQFSWDKVDEAIRLIMTAYQYKYGSEENSEPHPHLAYQQIDHWGLKILGLFRYRVTMDKWEYLFIGNMSHSYSGKMSVLAPSVFQITNKGFELVTDFKNRPKNVSEEDAVGQFIASLGEQGWEMTGVGNSSERQHCLYFKRPKP